MNAIARTAATTHGVYLGGRFFEFLLPLAGIKTFLMALVVLFSALSLVYVKDLNRRLFINQQSLIETNCQLNSNYGKLIVEESAWLAQARVQRIAKQRLNMVIPPSKDLVIVKLL